MRRICVLMYQAALQALSGRGLGRFRSLAAAHNFIRSQLKTNFVEIDGHKLFLDPLDSLSLSIDGAYGKLETDLIKESVQQGDVVLDLGANIGYYTLIFARLVGPQGRVFAFEPDPENFRLLERNVKENHYTNVVAINKAVSNKTERLKLYLSDDNKADHRIYDSHDSRR